MDQSRVRQTASPMDADFDRASRMAFLEDNLDHARILTDHLFAQVLPDALYDRPIPDRHRLVFYMGHLDAFEWNIVGGRALGQDAVSSELDSLFAFGIDPPEGELPQDEPKDWPRIEDVARYVADVRSRLRDRFHEAPERAARMALEHRLMHAETLTYLLHNLPIGRRLTRAHGVQPTTQSPPLQFIRIPAGIATVGVSPEKGYCWDNEMNPERRSVESFAISKYKVTNGQYLAFVNDGGTPPHYWIARNGRWRYLGFHGEVPLPLDFPVYVTFLQAQAFAQWKGKALPTEEQFHRAAFGAPSGIEFPYAWGQTPPHARKGNFNFRYDDSIGVWAIPETDSAFGVSQLVGNGWEWTSSAFAPFRGFRADPLYPEYSANFFDGNHHTVKGASPATHHLLMRRSFRNWFRDHYCYAYTTFRLVEN